MYTMQLILFCLVFYFANIPLSITIGTHLWEKYSKFRKKVNKILKKQRENEFFVDINEFEYPKSNESYRAIHREFWQEYYECLKRRYSEVGLQKTVSPTAIVALEGTTVKYDVEDVTCIMLNMTLLLLNSRLKCKICISPTETNMSENIEWYYNSTISHIFNMLIEQTDNILITPENDQLIIYNVQFKQTGQYWCKLGDMLSAPYYLSIDNDSQVVNVVYPNDRPNGPHATPERIISEYKLKVYTTWTAWSPCSACDAIGKKIRYGYCTVSLQDSVTYRDISSEYASSLYQNNMKKYKRQNAVDEEGEQLETTTETKIIDHTVNDQLKAVLDMFRNKLPCKSKYITKILQDIPDIKNRTTEMMIRYCKKKCRKDVIFEIRDKQGNVVESANNSAGVYSMIQGMPMPSPAVVRTTVYEKHNKKTTLKCPGNLNTDTPIVWKMNTKILNPSSISDQSSGRVQINSQMHIIFRSLRFKDANIYSCWQNDEIVGVTKLIVTGEIELQMNYSAILVGGILIIAVFVLVFWKAFKGRKRFTMR